jgi:hypothetical protein
MASSSFSSSFRVIRVFRGCLCSDGKELMILAEGVESSSNAVGTTPLNNALLNALAKGYIWQQQIENGQFEGLDDVAQANGVDRSYVGRVLQLTSLAPDIVESILAGKTFADISLQRCRKGIPVAWDEQRNGLLKKLTATAILECQNATDKPNPTSDQFRHAQ